MVGENYSSKFSAWLALGCLSPREIYFELKKYETQYEANESTYWLIFELPNGLRLGDVFCEGDLTDTVC